MMKFNIDKIFVIKKKEFFTSFLNKIIDWKYEYSFFKKLKIEKSKIKTCIHENLKVYITFSLALIYNIKANKLY